MIATSGLPKTLERVEETCVRAGAGLTCMRLARQCARWQLGPAAFFAGIPGTVGGALAMNAGAFGGETWGNVERVETIDRQRHVTDALARGLRGRLPQRDAVRGRSGSSVSTFRFAADATATLATLKGMLAKRGETQPLGVPSCGSVFRNPPGDFRRTPHRGAGLKGLHDRRRTGLRQACELHRQHGSRHRGRYRGADRARAGQRSSDETGVRARARGSRDRRPGQRCETTRDAQRLAPIAARSRASSLD